MKKNTSHSGMGKYFLLSIIFILIAGIGTYLFPFPKPVLRTQTMKLFNFTPFATPTPDTLKLQEDLQRVVFPDSYNLGISFGDAIIKLIDTGAIDKEKFLSLYENRGGLGTKEKAWLEEPNDEKIILTKENEGVLLNLFWPLGIANKTNMLSDGPMGPKQEDSVGNYASTGGWTIGKKSGGELFNSLSIVSLTPIQEEIVKEIAEGIYRPCCGNSTFFPDCNHGAAMLGFIELAVAAGMPKDDIYKKALVLNSIWFPQTYLELAIYFQELKGTKWQSVDPKEVLSGNYSSATGYMKVTKELQTAGLLPKIEGGGSCGV